MLLFFIEKNSPPRPLILSRISGPSIVSVRYSEASVNIAGPNLVRCLYFSLELTDDLSKIIYLLKLFHATTILVDMTLAMSRLPMTGIYQSHNITIAAER